MACASGDRNPEQRSVAAKVRKKRGPLTVFESSAHLCTKLPGSGNIKVTRCVRTTARSDSAEQAEVAGCEGRIGRSGAGTSRCGRLSLRARPLRSVFPCRMGRGSLLYPRATAWSALPGTGQRARLARSTEGQHSAIRACPGHTHSWPLLGASCPLCAGAYRFVPAEFSCAGGQLGWRFCSACASGSW